MEKIKFISFELIIVLFSKTVTQWRNREFRRLRMSFDLFKSDVFHIDFK